MKNDDLEFIKDTAVKTFIEKAPSEREDLFLAKCYTIAVINLLVREGILVDNEELRKRFC